MHVIANGFVKPHTNFDVLLSMHESFELEVLFFSDIDISASSMKKCLPWYLTYHLKARRTSNSMVLKLPTQK